MVNKTKEIIRFLRRALKMTAIHKVFRRLRLSGVKPEVLNTLEVFGCDGKHHTREVASTVANLDIWELNPKHEPLLRQRFPNADVKITDSYLEIERTSKKFDLVLIDNSEKANGRYEHFDLFPAVLQVLTAPAILVLDVTPRVQTRDSKRLRLRQEFYNAKNPARITFSEMETAYQMILKEHGWSIDEMFFERRWRFNLRSDPFYYAVLKLTRVS